MKHDSRIIVALDYATTAPALALTQRLEPTRCKLKIGKELFTHAGPDIVRQLTARGFEVFLDLKFHDIPNTVAKACSAAAELGVWMLNVHTLGGRAMLLAAREAIDKSAHQPLLIGVTILTSMSDADLLEIGITANVAQSVQRLAALAQDTKLDGVVCSALEAASLRAATSSHFKLVTPGIRWADSAVNDQKRIATPANALADGADYLVIGRPITQASDPMAVIARIEQEIHHLG
jgi:orotidine-5'-phosphate decarboxylase